MNTFKKLRLASKLTQSQVARQVGISVRNYQKIEHELHLPRVDRAITIAKVLNTTVEELFTNNKHLNDNTKGE